MNDRIRQVTIREDPLTRLGALLTEARLAKKDPRGKPLTVSGMAKLQPLSRQPLADAEHGTKEMSPGTYRLLEDFHGWPAGSILRYLHENGPEPTAPELAGAPSEVRVIAPGYELLSEEKRRVVDDVIRSMLQSRGTNGNGGNGR